MLHMRFGSSLDRRRVRQREPNRGVPVHTRAREAHSLDDRESFEIQRWLLCLVQVSNRPVRASIAARIRRQLRNVKQVEVPQWLAPPDCAVAQLPRGQGRTTPGELQALRRIYLRLPISAENRPLQRPLSHILRGHFFCVALRAQFTRAPRKTPASCAIARRRLPRSTGRRAPDTHPASPSSNQAAAATPRRRY